VWRAQFGPELLDVAGFDDPTRMRQDVERLIADWSYRIGWPYLGCRVASVVPVGVPKVYSFATADDQSRVYKITLDLGGGEPGERTPTEIGWLRISADMTEFQLEPRARTQERAPAGESHDWNAGEIDIVAPATAGAAQRLNEPMWDRWLDV